MAEDYGHILFVLPAVHPLKDRVAIGVDGQHRE